MKLLKNYIKKVILTVIIISTLINFFSVPSSYARLELNQGEYYYSATGKYTLGDGIFKWLVESLGQIADWLVGIFTMGIRMAIVGWTALIEKILTWTLESTAGVNIDGLPVINSTDLSNIEDSSSNVTVEAIVYNQVPVFDVNIFKDDIIDRTGTGKEFICEVCHNNCGNACECINKPDCCTTCKVFQSRQVDIKKTVLYKLKIMIAKWYYVLRILAIAAMLVILIVVGIKMAISSLAQDKALYKRMLVDWVAGFIILFSIHYFMLFIINMNEIMVNLIRDVAQEEFMSSDYWNIQMKPLVNENSKFDNSQLELSIYKEVKTKAYSPKFLDGTTGMIMYVTLVFFAYKYSLIYIKRFFTIAVLTIMAPAVGLSYAVQKVLTGKSVAFNKWFTEYLMNVIIQMVHALLYSLFIARALLLSMESISGMILALVLLNYVSKADELFKKIFKFGGSGSLSDSTEHAMDDVKNGFNTIKGLRNAQGAKVAAKILTNNPYAKAVKALGKGTVTAGVGMAYGASKLYSKIKNDDTDEDTSSSYEDKINEEMQKDFSSESANQNKNQEDRRERAIGNLEDRGEFNDKALLETGGFELKDKMDKAKKELDAVYESEVSEEVIKNRERKYISATRQYNRWQELTKTSNNDIIKQHFNKLIKMEGVFTNTKTKNKFKKAMIATFGTYHFDRKNMRFVNDGNAVYKQFSAKNLFGFTESDSKKFKELSKDLGGSLVGMASVFVGLGTLLTKPSVGFGLITVGSSKINKVFGKDTNIASSGRYTFGGYSKSNIRAISNSAIARAQQEHNAILAEDINRRHPNFVTQLKNGFYTAATLGTTALLTGGTAVPVITAAGIGGVVGFSATRFFRDTKIYGKLDEIDRHHTREQKKLEEEFYKETESEEVMAILAAINARNIIHEEKIIEEEEIEKMGYKIDPITDEVITDEEYKKRTRNRKDSNGKIVTSLHGKDITQTEVDSIHKEIDLLLFEVSHGKIKLDGNDQKVQNQLRKELTDRLILKGILQSQSQADELYKDGKNGLVDELKQKIAHLNVDIDNAPKTKADSQAVRQIATAKARQTTLDRMAKRAEYKKQTSRSASSTISDGTPLSNVPTKFSKEKQKRIETALLMALGSKLEEKRSNSQEDVLNPNGTNDPTKKGQNTGSGNPITGKKKTPDEILNQLLSQSGAQTISDGEKQVYLSRTEAKYVAETVKSLLELKAINEQSLKRRGNTKLSGPKSFIQAYSDRSEVTIERAKLQREEIELYGRRDTDIISSSGKTVRERREEIRKEIHALDLSIKSAKERMNTSGPVIDIEDYVKNKLFNNGQTKKRK